MPLLNIFEGFSKNSFTGSYMVTRNKKALTPFYHKTIFDRKWLFTFIFYQKYFLWQNELKSCVTFVWQYVPLQSELEKFIKQHESHLFVGPETHNVSAERIWVQFFTRFSNALWRAKQGIHNTLETPPSGIQAICATVFLVEYKLGTSL